MSDWQSIRLGIGIAVIVAMFLMTAQFRADFNKRESYFQQLEGQELPIEVLADAYVEFDTLAAESLYRRIWTYNGIVFLSGCLLIYLTKEEEKKKKQ